ncbi:phosphomannomutase/phosphoglucomutase [Desulfoferrobacter suflitae]|uniref:phosphomannomutase/phosphoglucomutase n=1 Tax=Desulfoferrobacter suflitae TaxID=2865782 RepID=UPI002164ECFB|nr:phosphomannomutase/phosphoglucomutase [Desulfoferrobacter suflitae]MCK8603060.1 phosphomannomutase/phosphoglucomutase [Desulfoferrobacter suflitae]
MDPKVFREYDIRGIVDQEIEDRDVVLLGKAFATYMAGEQKRRVVVGRDCRLSSERYRKLLVDGLLAAGMEVVDVGLCPTPVFYFAIRQLQAQGGIMITASHNPPEYNGFKVCNGFDTISGAEIQKLRGVMEGDHFVSGNGRLSRFDVITPYVEFVVQNIRLGNRLRVGVDAGNATAGPLAVPILEKLGCEVHPLYCDMDGTFPNHEPDPTVLENLQDLIGLVKEKQLDVGIAYDGDSDRLGVVNHLGEVVYGDKLMVIFAREILARRPGSTFISEVKCSKTLYDDIEQRGGRAIMWRTGHSLIKAKMREEDAVLAGEMSGHMFFKDRYFGYDDGIYASCRLLEILSNSGKTIPQLLEGIPVTETTPEIRVACPDEIKFDVVARATRFFKAEGYDVIDVDGARIVFPDGWGLVRASNTQPVLVLRYEAQTPGRLEEIRKLVENTIADIKRC